MQVHSYNAEWTGRAVPNEDYGGIMRTAIVSLALILIVASSAFAADDGQTQPRLSNSNLNSPNTSIDIIATTNGAGNVKGVNCSIPAGAALSISFYVNGGSAQTIPLYNSPTGSNLETGWVPFNVRFTSSIRVSMSRALSPVVYGDSPCAVSWALD
jgi:hypothetical protein